MTRPHTLGAWWLSICGAASALLIVGSAAYTVYEQRERLIDLAIRAVSRKAAD